MSMLETISVRLFDNENAPQIQLLFDRIGQGIEGIEKPRAASLFNSCGIPEDWTIQLVWTNDTLPRVKTALGTHLCESLRPLGFVHHCVWQAFSSANIADPDYMD